MIDERYDAKNTSPFMKNDWFLKGDLRIMKTLKNKVVAIALLGFGYLGTLFDNDITALIFFAFIAIPMFFAKENWIY